MSEQPLSAIAEINPPLPRHVHDAELVSFVGMSDVKESGGITSIREVPFEAVKAGFTRFAEGDVLFAKITPCMENGKGALAAGLTNGIGCGSTEFHVLRAKGENCNGFIYQVVQSRAFRQKAEMNMSGSAGQQRVPSNFFKEFPVHIPAPPQQRRIAEILSTLDEAIEQTEALIAKMQQLKAGLMHDLFTRGVTPDGRLRPTREQAPELYKESPIGWIPREWEVSCCASEFIIDSGITLGPHRRPRKSPYPYLRVANVSRDSISLDDVALLEATPAEVSALGLKTYDLLVVEGHANRNEIGRCSMVFNDAEGMLFQNHLFRLRPIRLGRRYSLLWLNSFYAQSYWESKCATSSGLYTINRKLLGAMPVIVPRVEEQDQIGEIVFSFREKESVNASYRSKLRQQKQGLMCDLLTGSVQVSELIGERSMDIAIAE